MQIRDLLKAFDAQEAHEGELGEVQACEDLKYCLTPQLAPGLSLTAEDIHVLVLVWEGQAGGVANVGL
jgi:hypothetical protein